MKIMTALLSSVMLVSGAMQAPAQTQSTPAQDQGQPAPKTDVQGTGNLSEKLSNTGGVIHPEGNVDPGIRKPPADAGSSTMPVIPPPGSPGGDQTVVPK